MSLAAVTPDGQSSNTHLLYRSSDFAAPNIQDFVDAHRDASLAATVVLVRAGSYIFGGYAAESWILYVPCAVCLHAWMRSRITDHVLVAAMASLEATRGHSCFPSRMIVRFRFMGV